MAKRIWYKKWIGYCFNDEGKEVILEDIFYFEEEGGKNVRTGYELHYPGSGKTVLVGLDEMRRIARQTNLPR